jgi:hypothetical protein
MHVITNLGLKMHQDLQNHLGTRHLYIFITSKDRLGLSFMKFHIKHLRTDFKALTMNGIGKIHAIITNAIEINIWGAR